MSIAQIKINTEQYILDNWTASPIYFDSQPVVGNNAVLVKFVAYDRQTAGLGRRQTSTMLSIYFYGSSTLKAIQLQDDMNTLLECWVDGNTYYNTGVPEGTVDMDNGVIELKVNYLANTIE